MYELLKKLQYKENDEIVILNAPAEFAAVVTELSKSIKIHHILPKGKSGFILVFVLSRQELERNVQIVVPGSDTDTVLWFAYPKKSSKKYKSDINRDSGWEILGKHGYEGVRQIAIDDDWSALRFRHISKIKSFSRDKVRAMSKEGKSRRK